MSRLQPEPCPNTEPHYGPHPWGDDESLHRCPGRPHEHATVDPVDHPPHYQSDVEPIDAIEAWSLGFCLGNAVKYIARAGRKGDRLEDLRKAAWYLAREIGKEEVSRG